MGKQGGCHVPPGGQAALVPCLSQQLPGAATFLGTAMGTLAASPAAVAPACHQPGMGTGTSA